MASAADPAVYKEMLVVLGTAGVVIPIFHKLRINSTLGFLIAGVLLGPGVLGALAADHPWLRAVTFDNSGEIAHLAELGIVFLLFMIGIELSFERLVTMKRLVFGFGLLQLLLSASTLTAAAMVAGLGLTPALIAALALSLSSTAVVVQLLADSKRMGSQTGRISFAVLLLQDIAVVPVLILIGILGSGPAENVAKGAALALGQAGLTIAAVLVAGRLLLRPLLRLVAATGSQDLFLAATLLIAVGTGFLTSLGGLSMALGAFLAGLLLAGTEYRREVERLIEPFKGLLLGAFFMLVGMSIDPAAIAAAPGRFAALTFGFIAAKVALAIALGVLFRLPGRAVLRASLLLGPGGEFAFVVMGSALALGLVSGELASLVQASVSVSMLLIPLLAMLGEALAARVVPATALPPEAQAAPEQSDSAPVIIAGFGRVGQLVAAVLAEHGIAYLGIDSDPAAVARARRLGHPVFYGDAVNPDFLRRCGIEQAHVLAVTMQKASRVDQVIGAARGMRPDLAIMARARDEEHASALYACGVSAAVPETAEASLQLGEAVLVSAGVPMGLAIATIHQRREDLQKRLGARGRPAVQVTKFSIRRTSK